MKKLDRAGHFACAASVPASSRPAVAVELSDSSDQSEQEDSHSDNGGTPKSGRLKNILRPVSSNEE
jgi:hypothetical protein